MNEEAARPELYILANSPGELSGWVAPVVEQVRACSPNALITVALIPDWFTSGKEREFASNLPVNRVVGIFVLFWEIWRKKGAFAGNKSTQPPKRLILFLGGDALYAKFLADRLKTAAMAYMPRVYRPRHFVRIFVPDAAEKKRALAKGANPDRISVVAPLAFDSLKPSGDKAKNRERFFLTLQDGPVFSLLAGSRPKGVDVFFGFLLDAANQLAAQYPACRVLLPVSPFIDKAIVQSVLEKRGDNWTDDEKHGVWQLEPDRRILFVFGDTHDALAVSDVAMVLPGTNNLQCAAVGLPFIVMVPLNWIEHIPFEGLLGFLYPSFFPFNILKKYIIRYLDPRIPYLSLVNKMAGYMLAPEIRGIYTPATISAAASELWRDRERRLNLSAKLIEFTRERGAARKIAEAVHEYLIFNQRIR